MSKVLSDWNIQAATKKNVPLRTAFQLSKSHKLPFSASNVVYTIPLQLIECDLWGIAPCLSYGFQYHVSFVDAYSRHLWIYVSKKKSGTLAAFIAFK